MRKVTDKQKQMLGHIHAYWQEFGLPPTYRELAERAHFKAIRTVEVHLDPLEKKGCIVRDRQTSRSIRLTEYGLSLLGEVATVPAVRREIPCSCQEIVKDTLCALATWEAERGNSNKRRYLEKVLARVMKDLREAR